MSKPSLQEIMGVTQWRRRWGSGGALAPRLVSKWPNFGQFYIIWAILHQNFGQFHIFWAILRRNFGQFNIHQTVSILVKPFFFFLEITLTWTEKPIAFRGNLMSFFGQKFGAFPNPFELQRPWCDIRDKQPILP